jgi:hypothetical protein
MVDALCLDDLDANGGELDDPLAELYQDLYHRLIEAPGSNLDDPSRGYGIEGRLSAAGRKDAVGPSIKHGIESELCKDVRVHNARATVTSPADGEYRVEIEIVADEGLLGIVLVSDGGGVRRVA